ncbi:copper resistance CopC/CopD family protein [Streptomyces violaceus]|uniref:Copper resistance protein CopC n=1 Tax=Streptomyces violaceus TaxID=1936 RepID=A0ABZ1NUW2_STRVL|nr:copper resistance protein CopC [Streptomyces violaceus]
MERQGTTQARHVVRALLVVLAVLAGALLGGAAPAAAHAVLTGSDPRADTVLETAPEQVTVTLNEPVGLPEDAVRVVDSVGRPVTAGNPAHADGRTDTVSVRLSGGLKQGSYTVSWRAISADSHAVSGAFVFSVGAPSLTGADATAEPAVDSAVDTLYGIGRYIAYAGQALLVGIAVFALFCWPGAASVRRVRGLFLTGWWALAGSTVLLLLVRGPYESGGGPAGVADPRLLSSTVNSRPGVALLVRLALLVLVALLLKRGRYGEQADRRTVATGVGLALGLSGTWAVSEHASTGIQVPVAMVSSVLHLLAMSVWLGGLTALLVALRRTPADDPLPPEAVGRFSRLALASVTVLAVTGLYQSWRGLGSWEAFATPYGRMLALKTAAVSLMLAAAFSSRGWTQQLLRLPQAKLASAALVTVGGGDQSPPPDRTTTPDTAGPDPEEQRRRLRRSVTAEVLIGVVVLVVTTVLTGSQPGRADAETVAASRVPGRPDVNLTVVPFDTGGPAPFGGGKVQITLQPGRVGRNVVEVMTYGSGGGISAVPELRLAFIHTGRGIGPLDAELVNQSGYWGGDSLNLPVAGTWTLRATVRTSDIDQVTVEQTVEITR